MKIMYVAVTSIALATAFPVASAYAQVQVQVPAVVVVQPGAPHQDDHARCDGLRRQEHEIQARVDHPVAGDDRENQDHQLHQVRDDLRDHCDRN
jgi:hypothetical protein